ncbi:MAG: hypothetical protein IKM39_02355 [Clostridia bacterium]|nr:hypothetical protein [Clostridia bacterium]
MDFAQMKNRYIQGGVSYRRIGELFDVPYDLVAKTGRKEGWVALRKEALAQGRNAPEKSGQALCPVCNHGQKVALTADCLLDRMLKTIQQAEKIESGAFKQYTSALKDLRDIKGVKHPMELREQQLKLEGLQQKNEKTEEIQEILVTVQGGEDDWLQ